MPKNALSIAINNSTKISVIMREFLPYLLSDFNPFNYRKCVSMRDFI
ncbi:hypothetical protein THOG11_50247 [Vibrio harveyi]|nr:hypothetical protein TH15OA1_480282 [Vibrio harveyi]CAH1571034.1 hypothetical protein THOD03_40243 [Vibrio harveyi]CAH1581186.1 hypothetical protein THOG11_50247 [Vibrio harveyi]